MNHQELRKAFTIYLEQVGYGATTTANLPSYVAEFLFYTQPTTLETITRQDIFDYQKYLEHRPNLRKPGGLSVRMIHHHLYALRVFFGWLELTEQIPGSPMSGLRFGSPQSQVREPLTQTEVQELYAAAHQPLERAVLGLLYGCGLRKSELHQLQSKDVHFNEGLLYVRKGKGDQRRVVPMSDQVKEDLAAYYYYHRPRKIFGPVHYFLLRSCGHQIGGSGLYALLDRLEHRAGLGIQIRPHMLRHSIATHLLENGLPVEQVRDFLGHQHLESTQHYIRRAKLAKL